MDIFRAARQVESHQAVAWLLATALFVAALVARFWLNPALPAGFPYLTFFPAVILATFFCGLWPGIACAFASFLAAWYWFIGAGTGFQVTPHTALALMFFVAIVAVDIALIHTMKRSVAEVETARRTADALYGQQRMMFQELQHRVANNIQFISSLLSLQKRRVRDHPEQAVAVLDESRARLDTISNIHRRLYDPENALRPVDDYLRGLCNDVVSASGRTGIRCVVSVEPGLVLDLPKLMNLSLLAMELITNSLKHAFGGRQNGTIRLELTMLDAANCHFVIADDGAGMDLDMPNSPDSLGTRIVQSLASQLGGEILFANENGTVARLTFPLG